MPFDADSLTTQVGDTLRITITASTKPDTTMVDNWLKEGAYKFCRFAPIELLHKMYITVATAITVDGAKSYIALPSSPKLLRLGPVEYDPNTTVYGPITQVEPHLGSYYAKVGNNLVTVAWLENNKLFSNATPSPSTGHYLKGSYIPIPADSSDIPEEFHQHLIDYAVAKAKEQDGEGPGLEDRWLMGIGGKQ